MLSIVSYYQTHIITLKKEVDNLRVDNYMLERYIDKLLNNIRYLEDKLYNDTFNREEYY